MKQFTSLNKKYKESIKIFTMILTETSRLVEHILTTCYALGLPDVLTLTLKYVSLLNI